MVRRKTSSRKTTCSRRKTTKTSYRRKTCKGRKTRRSTRVGYEIRIQPPQALCQLYREEPIMAPIPKIETTPIKLHLAPNERDLHPLPLVSPAVKIPTAKPVYEKKK